MRLLIVAATSIEVQPLLSAFPGLEKGSLAIGEHHFDLLITGVGMVPTAFAVGHQLAKHTYTMALNLGIAGSFDPLLPIGEVVSVSRDIFAEWGAQDDEEFLSIDDLGFGQSLQTAKYTGYFQQVSLYQVRGITVNTAHGHEMTIAKTKVRLDPQIESMEGAAFLYACNQVGIDCLQVRAVSNYVERRQRDNWDIGLAVKNLNQWAVQFLNALIVSL